MSSTLTYDPKQFTLVIGGYILGGWADDDFVELERDEDAWAKKTGVDGETTRAKSNNRAGHLILRLMQSSSSNDDLSALALLDEATNAGAVPMLAKDGSGRSVFASDVCWVKKFPKTVFKKGVNMYEWTIDCGRLNIYVGGNRDATQ